MSALMLGHIFSLLWKVAHLVNRKDVHMTSMLSRLESDPTELRSSMAFFVVLFLSQQPGPFPQQSYTIQFSTSVLHDPD